MISGARSFGAPRGEEIGKEVQAVDRQRDPGDQDDDEDRQRGGDGDVAGVGEEIGEQPDEIAHQHEEEQREDEREEAFSLWPDLGDAHAVDEFV